MDEEEHTWPFPVSRQLRLLIQCDVTFAVFRMCPALRSEVRRVASLCYVSYIRNLLPSFLVLHGITPAHTGVGSPGFDMALFSQH